MVPGVRVAILTVVLLVVTPAGALPSAAVEVAAEAGVAGEAIAVEERVVLPPPEDAPATPAAPAGTRIAVRLDVPDETNAGEAILVTVFVRTDEGARLENVTIRVRLDPNYNFLPAWGHDEWRGFNHGYDTSNGARHEIVFTLDEVREEGSVYFHVVAPVGDEARPTAWEAVAASGDLEAREERVVLVRAAGDPEPARLPRQALVLAGWAATMTAPGRPVPA